MKVDSFSPLNKKKWLKEAYMSCFSGFKSAYEISMEHRDYVHYNYKKYIEENKDYFEHKEGKQKGDSLWKSKSFPVIDYLSEDIEFNAKDERLMSKIMDDDDFRSLITVKNGFSDITDIIDLFSIVSSITYVTKKYRKHRKLNVPKGVRKAVFMGKVIDKSFNMLEKVFPRLKQLKDKEATTGNLLSIQNILEGFSDQTLSKLMRCSVKYRYMPELIGSSLTTIDAFYEVLHKSR
jgi:hypothetical protein